MVAGVMFFPNHEEKCVHLPNGERKSLCSVCAYDMFDSQLIIDVNEKNYHARRDSLRASCRL